MAIVLILFLISKKWRKNILAFQFRKLNYMRYLLWALLNKNKSYNMRKWNCFCLFKWNPVHFFLIVVLSQFCFQFIKIRDKTKSDNGQISQNIDIAEDLDNCKHIKQIINNIQILKLDRNAFQRYTYMYHNINPHVTLIRS